METINPDFNLKQPLYNAFLEEDYDDRRKCVQNQYFSSFLCAILTYLHIYELLDEKDIIVTLPPLVGMDP